MSVITRTEGEVRVEWAELQELEKMVGKLTFTALKLSPGVERRDSLISIGSFRDRIAAMKRSGLEAVTAESSARRKA
jgi:hypothetical protein